MQWGRLMGIFRSPLRFFKKLLKVRTYFPGTLELSKREERCALLRLKLKSRELRENLLLASFWPFFGLCFYALEWLVPGRVYHEMYHPAGYWRFRSTPFRLAFQPWGKGMLG